MQKYMYFMKMQKKNDFLNAQQISPAAGLVTVECIFFYTFMLCFWCFWCFLTCLMQGSGKSTRGMIRKAPGMMSPQGASTTEPLEVYIGTTQQSLP